MHVGPADPWAFYPDHIIISSLALFLSLWACTCAPTPIFCSTTDPCSCKGGGFNIYETQCNAVSLNATGDDNGNNTNYLSQVKQDQANEYKTFVGFVSENSTLLAVVGFTFLCIALTFTMAHLFRATEKNRTILKKNTVLERENERIRGEIAVDQYDEEQVEIVERGRYDIQKLLKKKYEINWRNIVFKQLLGSGSFGDCYLGVFFDRKVAVKKVSRVCPRMQENSHCWSCQTCSLPRAFALRRLIDRSLHLFLFLFLFLSVALSLSLTRAHTISRSPPDSPLLMSALEHWVDAIGNGGRSGI